MKKTKAKQIEETLKENEIPENVEHENITTNDSQNDSLEDRFEQFSKQTAEFTPEQPNEGTVIPNEQVGGEVSESQENAVTRGIKIKMFVGFACFVLSGFGTWLLNMLKGTKVPLEKMYFTKEEKESLEPYMDDPKVLAFIDKLPTWLIAVGHVGILLNSKHEEFAKDYKIVKPKKEKE